MLSARSMGLKDCKVLCAYCVRLSELSASYSKRL
jgi:hypothetical protein